MAIVSLLILVSGGERIVIIVCLQKKTLACAPPFLHTYLCSERVSRNRSLISDVPLSSASLLLLVSPRRAPSHCSVPASMLTNRCSVYWVCAPNMSANTPRPPSATCAVLLSCEMLAIALVSILILRQQIHPLQSSQLPIAEVGAKTRKMVLSELHHSSVTRVKISCHSVTRTCQAGVLTVCPRLKLLISCPAIAAMEQGAPSDT